MIRVRLIDGSPALNVQSSVHVGIAGMPAGPTLENLLRSAVGFSDMSTLGAFTRGIARVDKDHWNTAQFRLVLDKRSQLREGPTAHLGSSGFLNPNPRTYPGQLLKDYHSIRVFSLSDDLFRDLVIEIFGEKRFFAAALTQSSLRGFGLFRLKLSPQSQMPFAQATDVRAGERLTVTVGRDSGNSQVNAQEAVSLSGRWLDHVDRGEQVELALTVDQIGFPLTSHQQLSLALSTTERDRLPSGQRPDRNVIFRVAKNPIIERYGAPFMEDSLNLDIQLVGIGNFGNYSDGKLRRKPVLFADWLIGKLVKPELTEGLRIPRDAGALIGGFISPLKSRLQRNGLLRTRIQFKTDRQFHSSSIEHAAIFDKLIHRPKSDDLKFLSTQTARS